MMWSGHGDAGNRTGADRASLRPGADPTPSVAAAVNAAIQTVYIDTGRPRRDITPASLLGSELGLDSLDLAQVIVLLERSLGVDPFRSSRTGLPPIRSVEHLITIYSVERANAAASPLD